MDLAWEKPRNHVNLHSIHPLCSWEPRSGCIPYTIMYVQDNLYNATYKEDKVSNMKVNIIISHLFQNVPHEHTFFSGINFAFGICFFQWIHPLYWSADFTRLVVFESRNYADKCHFIFCQYVLNFESGYKVQRSHDNTNCTQCIHFFLLYLKFLCI